MYNDQFQISPPEMCGYFSITTDREYDKSSSSLRYFKRPILPLNLDEGIADIKAKPDSYFEEKMDRLLRYLLENKGLISSPQYITYRGIIRMIMCSPYEQYKGWCILVTKYKNKFYLCQRTTKEDRDSYKKLPDWLKKIIFYGPKFEQCCSSVDPALPPNTTERLDECAQFFCVFKRMLIGRQFLFAGEMDGLDSAVPVNLKNTQNFDNLRFVELKVNPLLNPKNIPKFVAKCQNIWTQSFLTGVDDIYVGMRDQKGVVRKIEHLTQNDLLEYGRGSWTPSACYEFLEKFLDLVERKMRHIDCPDSVYEFNFDITTQQLNYIPHIGKTDLSILPDWYIEAINE